MPGKNDSITEAMQWVSKITTIGAMFALPPIIGMWLSEKLEIPCIGLLGLIIGFSSGLLGILSMCKTPEKNYKIKFSDGKPSSIVCGTCEMESYNPNDIKNKYCGNCHIFHEDKK